MLQVVVVSLDLPLLVMQVEVGHDYQEKNIIHNIAC